MSEHETPKIAEGVAPSPQSTPAPAPAPSGGVLKRLFLRTEFATAVLLVLAFIISTRLSPYFLDVQYLFDTTSLYVETGLIALAMTFVIISGNIDLSVAANLALTACVTGMLYEGAGLPLPLVLVLAIALSGFLGWLNGVLVARLALPSIAVTLGTMALYRGIAQILVGDHSIMGFPEWFTGVDRIAVGATPASAPLVIFLGIALVLGLVLHKTIWGRWVFVLGTNEDAARHSGVPVGSVKTWVFVLAGVMSGLAGIIMVSRLGVARFDHARGLELDAITAVVLGGASIYGGRGTIFGTVLALALIAILKTGMGVANVKAENQLAVIGTLLIVAVILTNLLDKKRS